MASRNIKSSDDKTTSSTDIGEDPREMLRKEMMEECEQIWRDIQDTHHRLASHKEDDPPVGIDNSNARLKILQYKQKKLQAQIEYIKNRDPEVVSKDLQFVEARLLSDMKKNTAQLQQTLKILKEQRAEIAGDIAWKRKLLEEQKAIQKSLEEKLQALDLQENDEQENSVLAELEAKKKEANQYHMTVMNQLGKFLATHFPTPNDDSEEGLGQERRYWSLQRIIEALMNRLFESPHDPYIKILPVHWPPYIELLLRSNIILRHPENCDLIKLVAFHA